MRTDSTAFLIRGAYRTLLGLLAPLEGRRRHILLQDHATYRVGGMTATGALSSTANVWRHFVLFARRRHRLAGPLYNIYPFPSKTTCYLGGM